MRSDETPVKTAEYPTRPMRAASLTRNSIWMLAGHGLRMALQAGYFVGLARVLGASDFGVFLAVLVIATGLAPFSGWGLGAILVLRTARSASAYPDSLYRFLITQLVTAPVLIGLLLVVVRWWVPEAPLGLVILVALSELVVFKWTEIAGQVFQGHERLSGTATLFAIAAFGRLLAVGALALGRGDLVEWGFFYFMATLLTAVIAVWMTIRTFGPPAREEGASALLGLGTFFALGTASKAAYTDIDKAILLRLAGDATAGIYGAAYKIVSVAFAPVQALLGAAAARLFRGGAKGVRGSFEASKSILPAALALGLISSAVLFFAAPLVPLVLGADYEEASIVVRWLSPVPLLQGIHYLFAETLAGAGRQAVRTAVQITSAAFNALLNFLFVGAYGWIASAGATIATEVLLIAALGLIVWKSIGIKGGSSYGDKAETTDSYS